MIPVAYNLRNLAVRKTTTLATAAGLALVVFVFASVMMLSNSIRKTMGRSASPDMAVVLRKAADGELSSGIEDPNVGVVLSSPGVAVFEDGQPKGEGELVVVILLDKVGTTGTSNVQVRGVTDRVLRLRPEIKIVEGRPAKPGTDEVIIGKAIRGRFGGVDLGQTFSMKKNRPATVVGIFEDGGSSAESEVWGDLNTIKTAFGREGVVSSIRVRLESASKFDAFKTSVEQNRQLQLDVTTEAAYYEKQSQGTALFITALGSVIAVFFAIGAMLGAMITMHASIANRHREIGTLRALGFSRTSIIFSFLLESVLLALGGGIAGALLSLVLSTVRFTMMNMATWSEMVFSFEPTPAIMGKALFFAVVMGVLGGLSPAIRAARMNPIVAMRG